jgi:hypothetical protein
MGKVAFWIILEAVPWEQQELNSWCYSFEATRN